MKPIIGVVAYPFYDKDNTEVIEVSTKVINFINKFNAIPIVIAPTNIDDFYLKPKSKLNELKKDELIKLKSILKMCDGIVKPGSYAFFPFHIDIYKYTLEHNVPYLGICNGMQVMEKAINPAISMEKNNSDVNHHNNYHEINIIKNTLLYKILGKDIIMGKSFHNYHVPYTNMLKVNATANDNYIEGLECDKCDYNLGVEWHPEADYDDLNSIKIFDSFIESAKKYAKKK